MAEQTTNYKLIKPALTDIPDITAMNPNWDTIDTELKDLDSKIENISPNITDSVTGVEYELNVDNGILSPDIAGEYTEFTITADNRADIGYTDSTTNLVIPSAFVKNGVIYKVIAIGNSAFSNCSNLTSVTIPQSVASIGDNAFDSCTNLTSVNIPDGVTRISFRVFYNCSKLTSVTIPDSVTSIGTQAFSGCSRLTSITIPDGVMSINHAAFSECSSLTNIIIPDSVTLIDISAFNECHNLTSVNIPDGITSITSSTFFNCSSLTNVTIPNSVTSIDGGAFCGCTDLTNVTIPDGVISISGMVFSGCSNLTNITIPRSVTSIGHDAFYNCTNLSTVYFIGSEEEWNSINISDGNNSLLNATIVFSIVQGDWNQNDETAPNYIKNRTHWEEEGEDIVKNEEILPAQVISPYDEYNGRWEGEIDEDSRPIVEENKFYVVVYDNIEYICQAIEWGGDLYLGNVSMLFDGVPDTNEPFLIDCTFGIFYTTTSGDHTFQIFNTINTLIAHPLDEKFIPNTIARKNEIPNVDSYINTHNTDTNAHPDIREALANKVNQGDITLSSFGITATAAELNYVDGVTSNIQTQLTNKAPKNHASTATTYGASSASNYGHAMASSTTPKANGAAAVGTETAKFARGDHIHPAQTEITGNAGSATKLQTARKINGIAFDGTADIVVPSSVKIGTITLTANGWVEDATLGAFKQTATIPNLANGHKVDLDADLNTINQLPASIVPYNDNGTFYAVTLTPPSVDIAVQYTLLATN